MPVIKLSILLPLLISLVAACPRAAIADESIASAATASCRTVADRYRDLPLQSGKSPLSRLSEDKRSGVAHVPMIMELTQGYISLKSWANSQTPPMQLPNQFKDLDLSGSGSIDTLEQLPGTTFYAVHSNAGTAHCYSSIYFQVEDGKIHIADPPPGLDDEESSACMTDRSFGTIDGNPVMFEEAYVHRPDMRSTLTIATWKGDQFAHGCRVIFQYEPEFSERTLNNWQRLGDSQGCTGDQCDALRKAAYEVVVAIQHNPQLTHSELVRKLSEPQQREYLEAESTAIEKNRGVNTQQTNDPASTSQTFPFRVPYVYDERLYMVEAGHFTIGWREFADWSVTFHEVRQQQLEQRAQFAIGMWKGVVKDVTFEAIPVTRPVTIQADRMELEALFDADQALRLEIADLEKKSGADLSQIKRLRAMQAERAPRNSETLERIISLHGWPGSTAFGEKAAESAFLILEHADISYQKKYLLLAEQASQKGEISKLPVAFLVDRVRLSEGQKQKYGTQIFRNDKGEWQPRPIEDEANVDLRRDSMELVPLSKYLRGFVERSGGRVHPQWAK